VTCCAEAMNNDHRQTASTDNSFCRLGLSSLLFLTILPPRNRRFIKLPQGRIDVFWEFAQKNRFEYTPCDVRGRQRTMAGYQSGETSSKKEPDALQPATSSTAVACIAHTACHSSCQYRLGALKAESRTAHKCHERLARRARRRVQKGYSILNLDTR
jgi:hypothetical protein